MVVDQCVDEGTGAITGIERFVFEQVIADCRALAEELRLAAAELSDACSTALQEAEMPGWVSSARLSYDLGRSLIGSGVWAAEQAFRYLAWQYDEAAMAVEAQMWVEFAL